MYAETLALGLKFSKSTNCEPQKCIWIGARTGPSAFLLYKYDAVWICCMSLTKTHSDSQTSTLNTYKPNMVSILSGQSFLMGPITSFPGTS